MIKYTRDNGCPWDERTCSNAARGGHLHVLKYAHENGCPWDEYTCQNALKRGHLGAFEYAIDNGCPIDALWCLGMAQAQGHDAIADRLNGLMLCDPVLSGDTKG